MSAGIIVNGAAVPVAGVNVVTFADDARLRCATRPRPTSWVRQLILHKTIADDPERILPGAGSSGGALATIKAWQGGVDGAHAVIDYDGTLYQLADLATAETYHATASNAWSVGFEAKEQVGGGVYEATLDAMVAAAIATCRALGIQLQMQRRGTYTGHPIARMDEHGQTPGGPDMIGIFGHRMNTERRGKWDPGEIIWDKLAAAGVQEFDFAAREDIAHWMAVQQDLIARKFYVGAIDGVPGPATVTALRAAGYVDGIYALGKRTA